MSESTIRLTQFSHGAGCGCKISPKILDQILATNTVIPDDLRLLVGNHSRDDAAVMDIGNGQAIISTTDFFMPIVDDPFDFGRIAATNAISDIYAMGGKPLMAIAILGWPIDKLSPQIAAKVIEGGRQVCQLAAIPLAGGHSIDAPEPIFGLAVTGIIPKEKIKKNNTAKSEDILFLTKPLGVGILTTAEKKGVLKQEHIGVATSVMTQLNSLGEKLGDLDIVHALTDITGFGLLGHLIEMAEGSGLKASIDYDSVPKITGLTDYLDQKIIPGGTNRNWDSYGHKMGEISHEQKMILCDPQTSGGLLIAVDPHHATEFSEWLQKEGFSAFSVPLGHLFSGQNSGAVIAIR